MSLYTLTNNEIIGETGEIANKIINNTLLYPIAKSFIQSHDPSDDIIKTYEHSIENIESIVAHDTRVDKYIKINDNTYCHFLFWIDNVRIYAPNSIESAKYSNFGFVQTPNEAFRTKSNYTCTAVGDVHYKFNIFIKTEQYESLLDLIEEQEKEEQTYKEETIENAWNVNIPIPIGCKWCSLRQFDPVTLCRCGEDMEGLKGFFIIESLIRYIIPIPKKPFNKPVILKNTYDEQLSRTDVLYTNGYEYEHSYYVVGAMVVMKKAHVGRGGAERSPPDFGFSLQFNDPSMNVEATFGTKHSKKLFNFVPIRYLFGCFGCVTDDELIRYIDPQMNNFGLINTVIHACLYGYKHKEVIKLTNVKVRSSQDGILLINEPLTVELCRYIVGMIILNTNTKNILLNQVNKNETAFRLLIGQTVAELFDRCMMPAIGDKNHGEEVDRNSAICVELGLIVKELYLIGYNLETQQDKHGLINKRIRNGQQMSREFKSFHQVRLREMMMSINKIFETTNSKNIELILATEIPRLVKVMGLDQSKSIINSFKGTSKEMSKLRTDILKFCNKLFTYNAIRMYVISSETRQKGASVTWDHRTVHRSELFYICPATTPEAGKQTGRFKSPSIYTYITVTKPTKNIIQFIQQSKNYIRSILDVDVYNRSKLYVIKINGAVMGYINEFDDVETLYKNLMTCRSNGTIDYDVSISLNNNLGRLDIWTDIGRLVSPFVIVENCFVLREGKINTEAMFSFIPCDVTARVEFLEWLDECASSADQKEAFMKGIRNRFIEYLDPDMAITNAVIAPTMSDFLNAPIKFTHIALPAHLHSVVASMIVGISQNTAVRASYSTNHVKQAIGPILSYPQLKYMVEMNVLISPQIPLARPVVYDYFKLTQTPYGQNVIIAFMPYKYNQHDSVILNQASVEEGLLKIDSFKTWQYKIDKNDEEFGIPSKSTLAGNVSSYQKLDTMTCLPKNISETFWDNDVIIGKISKTSDGISDTSVLNDKVDGKYPISAYPRPCRCVEKNKTHGDDHISKSVTLGQFRNMIVGDKLNSECAQKHTVGYILPPDLIPYTETGMRPDVIFNPPSVFKRKTFSQIANVILMKACALLGCPIECTPFHTTRSEEEIEAVFASLGLDCRGYETLFDPETGHPYKAKIFVGNHYMERQNHLVEMKLNVRNYGPRNSETGQPTHGRRAGGGLSLDRMGNDTMNAAGVVQLNRSIHLDQGSEIIVAFCKRCHGAGYLHKDKNEWLCPQCGCHSDFTIKRVPPASMLINHTLTGLHVGMEFITNE
jgi:DNA-directed RNA polymerase beta subunit